MKTSVCLAVLGALLVMCISSAEGLNLCGKPCEKLVRVRELVSFRYWVWGRYYTFTYYTWVYRTKKATCYEPCPINCEWSDWKYKADEDWSTCSVTCEKGQESRPMIRSIKTQAAYGGKQCDGPSEKLAYKDCDMKNCPQTICKHAESGVGHYTHLQKCNKFVQCESGKAHVKSCPYGTAWDSIGSKQCSSDALDHCQGIACIRGMHYPHQDDCSKFYKCDHNQMILQKCPDNQYWDIRVNTCTTDKTACKEARESRAYKPQELTCEVGEKIVSRAHCNKYYVCTNTGLMEMDCAPGTLFDAAKLNCTHAIDMSCVNEDEDDEPDTEEPKKCTNGEFLADDDDPEAFFQCVHGVRHGPTKCSSGLVFSKSHGCGWKTK